jgi:WD40 repeat protein
MYSPQGNQIASADMSGAVRLWDVETGACRVLRGHYDLTRQVVYSPDGSQIASVSNDKTVRLWDVETGVCTHLFVGHRGEVTRVVYSPQGGQVASASCDDKTIRLWDTESGECLHTLVGHEQLIFAIAYSPRGNLIVSWSDAQEARLWNAETGDCYWNLNHDGSTPSGGLHLTHLLVWMSSDADSFVTGDGGGSVRVWDVTEEGDQYRVNMRWRSANGQLTVKDACVQNVRGLSDLDKRLLKQRGATGEPSVRLHDASKKMMTMASVVSKLKSSSSSSKALNQLHVPAPPAIPITNHSGKQSEQVTDPETRETRKLVN